MILAGHKLVQSVVENHQILVTLIIPTEVDKDKHPWNSNVDTEDTEVDETKEDIEDTAIEGIDTGGGKV